jgi:eukaryotic-like serine/threonine-protein kinase
MGGPGHRVSDRYHRARGPVARDVPRLFPLDGPLPCSWSQHALAVLQGADIWISDPAQPADLQPFVTGPAREVWPAFSPDGRWLAYGSDETGRFEVYVRPYPAGEPKYRVSTDGGREPVWSPDQRQLFFLHADAEGCCGVMMAVDVSTSDGGFRRMRPRRLFQWGLAGQIPVRGYDIAPDGRRFVAVAGTPREPEPVTSVHIVQNWFEELERLVPNR